MMEVAVDHISMFVAVPLEYSPSEAVQIMKTISARKLFKRFPMGRKQVQSGEFWRDGYFARNGGVKIT